MISLDIKPGHKSVKAYYEAIGNLSELSVSPEGGASNNLSDCYLYGALK